MNFQKFTTFKTILIALVLTINANQLFAQATNGIFFQAVARDNFSNPAKDRKIYVQSSIIQTTTTGTKVLTEEHQANTDATGVFSISLGNGVRVGGTASSLATIDWSKGPFYLNLKVAITPIGGNSNWNYNKEWVDMGTTSFGAVPFALYSASSAKVDDKLNVSDTTTMLKVYAKAMSVQTLENAVASKLTAADTLTMLKPYAKAAYTIDSNFFRAQLATKLSIADSTKYVTPTQLAAKTFDQTPITNAMANKLNIADSTKYVTPTQLASYNFSSGGGGATMDTTSLSNRINLKANTSDLTSLNTSVTSNTASITANTSSISSLTNNINTNTASITANVSAINLKAPIASPLFTGTVGIGTTNPSSAAALDITSTTQGLLLPRLNYVQKTAISNPVAGLVLWCTDCGSNGEMQVYNGTAFVNIVGGPAQFALPTVSLTSPATAITSSALTSGGSIESDGGAFVTARGVVWNTSPNPTVSFSTKTTDGTGIGNFSSSITGLTSGITYYIRAYATNSEGTKYGPEISVNTAQAVATLAATTAASAINATTVTTGGNITYNGGATVTTSGVVWSTSSNPTIALSTKTTDGAATGVFASNITGLSPGTLYYVRSYATNNVGTSYGAQISFTTLNTPTVSATIAGATITSSSASSGGTITSDGGAEITSRGIVYGTSTNSYTYTVTTGTGTGTYTSSMSGLSPATTYYVKAFATNSVGTVYGPEINFTTIAIAPSITTNAASSVTKYAATSGGIITSNGGSAISASGICWSSTNTTPTISDSKTTDGTTSGTFTSTLTGLTAGTTYYVRAYASNGIGTSYGSVQNFTTSSSSSANPVLASTTTASEISSTTATTGGNVTDEGSTQVSVRGLVYGTTTGSSTYSVTVGSGAGTFTSTLTGLSQGTKYFVRSFATNTQGTGYGAETSFTTQTTPTVSVTATPSSLTTTSAVGGGTISSTGGATITVSGLVWDANVNPSISLSTKTTDGATSGTFTSSITGLTQGATYHVRAYATNIIGTSYGPDITFTTLTTPTVSVTASVTSITGTTATGGGTISSDGGASITARGIVYGTITNSYTYTVTSGTGTGTYTSSLTGLTPATTYFVRAFATNSIGTVYGTEINFTTSAVLPTLDPTAIVSSITKTTALSGGNITDNGGAAVTLSGIVWSTTSTPTIALSTKTTDGTSTGTYTSSLTGLTAATTYYVRSYATNSVGTNYGTQTSFTTLAQAPIVSATATPTSITRTTAIVGGTISLDGIPTATRGLVYGTSSGASTYSVTVGSGAGTYSTSISSLTAGTTYFVRAFASNSLGIVYGPEQTFTTTAPFSAPNIVTSGLLLNLDAANPASYSGSGTTWTNLATAGSSSVPNFTINNSATFNSVDGAIKLSTGGNAVASTTSSFGKLTSYSIEVWVKSNNLGGSFFTERIYNPVTNAFGSSPAVNMMLSYGIDMDYGDIRGGRGFNNISTGFYSGGWHSYQTTSSDASIVDTWTHIIATFDETTKIIKIYKNGSLLENSTAYSVVPGNASNFGYYIGSGNWGGGAKLGDYSIVNMYNRALSPTEISTNYEAVKARFGY